MYISAFIPNHIHKYKGSLFSEHIWCLSYLQTIEQNHCPDRTLPTKQTGKHGFYLFTFINKKAACSQNILFLFSIEQNHCTETFLMWWKKKFDFKLFLKFFCMKNILIPSENMPPLQKQGLGQQQSTDATCHVT